MALLVRQNLHVNSWHESEAIPESEYWNKVKDFDYELEKIRSGQQVQDF
jgi:hypothetical protein